MIKKIVHRNNMSYFLFFGFFYSVYNVFWFDHKVLLLVFFLNIMLATTCLIFFESSALIGFELIIINRPNESFFESRYFIGLLTSRDQSLWSRSDYFIWAILLAVYSIYDGYFFIQSKIRLPIMNKLSGSYFSPLSIEFFWNSLYNRL